jgi:cell volume regulation protein A
VPLGELAKFYGLPMPARIARTTAAQLFDERFDAQPQVGDRLAIGHAVLVVRGGEVLLPEECGAFAALDYAYFVAPGGQAPRLDWLFADGRDAREAEQDTFGSFTLPGDVPLGELAKFYGLPMPARIARATAAQLFDERFDALPQVGDRLAIGRAVLVVREVRDDRVTRIGLKFTGVGERLISG